MAYKKEKLEELLHRKVSEIIFKEVKDPRIGFATVTNVNINKDFSIAKIGISVIGTEGERKRTIDGLKSAGGYIQHRVGKSIKIRYVPRLDFVLDSSIADGVEMVDLLEGIVEKEKHENNHNDDDDI